MPLSGLASVLRVRLIHLGTQAQKPTGGLRGYLSSTALRRHRHSDPQCGSLLAQGLWHVPVSISWLGAFPMGSRGLSHAHKGAGGRNLLVWSMCAVGCMYPLLLSMQLTLDGPVGAEHSGLHHAFEMDPSTVIASARG